MSETEIAKQINKVDIEIRTNDRFINATQLCKAAGKSIAHYLEDEKTKDFIEVAKKRLNQEVMEVNDEGIWIHKTIALHLSAWLLPEFLFIMIEVYRRYDCGDLSLAGGHHKI